MTDKKTILIVDDEPDVVAYLTVIFEDNGYETIPAEDGLDAFEAARRSKPDLITLDIAMPGQSGLRTYKDVKGDPATAGIPVIIITAAEESMAGFRQLLDGEPAPEGFLNKPINTDNLLKVAEAILVD